MFSRYAAVVKNLRGILLFDADEKGVKGLLDSVVRRFKYRNVGVSPSMLDRRMDCFEEHLGGKPFVELAYPVKGLIKLTRLIESEFGVERIVAEGVVLASVHVSPILGVGKNVIDLLEPLEVDRVESRVELKPRDLKLHMRIADYSVLDLYQWSVEGARRLWHVRDPHELVRERRERIAGDKRRYWRLQRGDTSPSPFLLYVDPVQRVTSSKSFLKRLRRLPEEETAAGLAILTVVLLR